MLTVEKGNIIFLLAGGPSARGLDVDSLKGKGLIVGVNDMAIIHPVDIAVTMDGLWLKHRWEAMSRFNIPLIARRSAFQKYVGMENLWKRVHLFEWGDECYGLSKEPDRLNGHNSGFCAFDWVIKQEPSRVYLYGFDLDKSVREGHCYKDYEWAINKNKNGKFDRWIEEHNKVCQEVSGRGIQVFNVNPESAIQCYRRITHADVLRQLC